MDLLLRGVLHPLVVTVRQLEINSGVCSRFRPQVRLLLRFWKMDPSLPGGGADSGGDSSAVSRSAQGCQKIQAASGAFAAILEDESVVTWGYKYFGGDSSAVQDQLKGVKQIQAITLRVCCDSGRSISRYLG